MTQQTQALIDVIAERDRQQDVEGWTPEHDDAHTLGEIAYAASSYLGPLWLGHKPDGSIAVTSAPLSDFPPLQWVWDKRWWKPGGDSIEDYRRRLVKGVALGLAEIERLDRAAAKSAEVK